VLLYAALRSPTLWFEPYHPRMGPPARPLASMFGCFASFTALFGSECQSTLIFLVGIAGSGLFYAAKLILKHTAFKHNFNLRFIDHPPPNHTIHNFQFPYSLPIGKFKLCCGGCLSLSCR